MPVPPHHHPHHRRQDHHPHHPHHRRHHLLPLLLPLLLLPAACTAVKSGRGAQRGTAGDVPSAAQAARSRYRAILDSQRPPAPSSGLELIPLTRPAQSEAGILRDEFTEYLPVLRRP